MIKLTRKKKAIIIIINTIIFIIVLGVLGIYNMGPTRVIEGWVGGKSKYGAPGDSVYFNYSVESRGGRVVSHFEIKDFQCDWEYHITTNPLEVHPGETRNLSIRIDVPIYTEIGDELTIRFRMHNWESIYGDTMGKGYQTETISISVIEKSTNNNVVNDEEWIISGRGTIGGFDIRRFVLSVYIILFVQVIIFYLIPELKSFIRNRK